MCRVLRKPSTSNLPFGLSSRGKAMNWIINSAYHLSVNLANELRFQYPSLSGFARESVPSDCPAQQKQIEETPIIQNFIQYPSMTGLTRQSVSSDFSAQQKQIEETPIIRNKPNHGSGSEVLPPSGGAGLCRISILVSAFQRFSNLFPLMCIRMCRPVICITVCRLCQS